MIQVWVQGGVTTGVTWDLRRGTRDADVFWGEDVCVCLQENPYVMLRHNHQELQGNERYEGFCMDMLKELAQILKFKYQIRLVADGVYGVSGTNGTWTGMVGELISRVRAGSPASNT